MARLQDVCLPGFLLLLSFVVASQAQGFGGSGISAFVPFPGVQKCVLVSGMKPNKILQYHPLGDIRANGNLRITVYQMQGRINLKLKLDADYLTGALPPNNITVYDSRSGGALGLPVFGVTGRWQANPAHGEVLLRTWILDASNKYPPGSTLSYYDLIRQIDLSPRSFFASLTTERYKWGALRGRFIRGAVNMMIPVPVC
ncbi:unnamed protein product [Closterium sp. NIES-53]